jgi:predicted transcriptional regulator
LFYEYEGDVCKRRDRLFIIADILKAARKGVSKTEIMYKAGLSFVQLTEYLSLLVRLELVEALTINGKLIYKTTAKGTRYLKSYGEMRRLLQERAKHNITNRSSPLSYP